MTSTQTILIISTAIFLAGCNQSASDPQSSQNEAPDAGSLPVEGSFTEGNGSHHNYQNDGLTIRQASGSDNNGPELRTASLTRHQNTNENYSLPASGTPEWDIRQIALLIAKESRDVSASEKHQRNTALNIVSNETARRIIPLASHAISETHLRPEKELIFNAAVQSMMDAHLKLALSGEKQSLDAIYENAATLAKERPGTTASVIAAGTVVNLAKEMASNTDKNSPWTSEYVKQTKLFAINFPKEEARSIMQLTSAGQFCEQRQLVFPAIECYTMIQQQFPQSPFRGKAEAALNRLGLIGKKIAISGPTIDGGTFQLTEKTGKPVVLFFWSTRSKAFLENISLINQLAKENQHHLVGINMDNNASVVKQFIASHQLAGEHIFYTDFALQGASQPLARQFGVNVVPTYWYIDSEGQVLATNVSQDQLQSLIKSR